MSETQSQCNGCQHDKQLFAKLDQYIDSLNIDQKHPHRKDTLSLTLNQAQIIFGFLPRDVQVYIAKRYNISQAEVSGVISFYNFFSTKPKGKTNISVCLGTACYVNGADKVLQDFEKALNIKSGEVTEDGRFSIQSLRCVGACGLAPVVMVNDKVYGKVKVGDAHSILEKYLVEVSAVNEEVKNG